MKKTFPVLVAIALLVILLYAFAQSTSFDYYKQKSSSELHALIFTESDNLFPALDVLNDLGDGAILVVNNSTNEAYIIEESIGDWDFEVYIEQGQSATFREKFYPTNCGGAFGDDYHVPTLQQTAGSSIKLSEITANCKTRLETFTYAQKKEALSNYATNLRNAYRALAEYTTLSADAITLAVAPTGELKAVLEATPTTGTFPLAVKFNISKSTASTGQALEKYELDFGDGTAKATGNWPAAAQIEHTYNKAATAKLTIWEKTTGKTATATVGIGTTAVSVECKTILECLAQVDKKFVDGIFK